MEAGSWKKVFDPKDVLYVWTCDAFSLTNFPYVESPSFKDDIGRSWNLSFQLYRSQYLFTLRCRSDATVEVIPFIHFLDKGGKIFQSKQWKTGHLATFVPGINHEVTTVFPFTPKDKLELLLYGGNLRIQLRLVEAVTGGEGTKIRKVSSTLASDLSMLFENATLADITIFSGSETFSAHKAILAGRSPVFRAMLEAPMKGTATNSLTMHDFSVEVVKGMLHYLYSDDVTVVTPTLATQFLQIADMHSLDKLKRKAEYILSTNITAENVVEVLRHAVTYKLDSLKSHAVAYIAGEDVLLEDILELKEFARTNLKDFLQLIKDKRLVAKVPQLIDIATKAA